MWLHLKSLTRNRTENSGLRSKRKITNTATLIPSKLNETEIQAQREHECDHMTVLSSKCGEWNCLVQNQRVNHHYDHTTLNLIVFQRKNMNFLISNSLIFILPTVSNLHPTQKSCTRCTRRYRSPIFIKSRKIWSQWQLWTKMNSIWFPVKRNIIITIIFSSIWQFCRGKIWMAYFVQFNIHISDGVKSILQHALHT